MFAVPPKYLFPEDLATAADQWLAGARFIFGGGGPSWACYGGSLMSRAEWQRNRNYQLCEATAVGCFYNLNQALLPE